VIFYVRSVIERCINSGVINFKKALELFFTYCVDSLVTRNEFVSKTICVELRG